MKEGLQSSKQNMETSSLPLISVIVPAYKVEQYLDQCLESVVNQTYQNLEIILVDDGSPDNCGRMCDEWADKDSRIVVIHKENGGLSDARNKGMSKASGLYIAHIDSDDVLDLHFIEYLYRAILQTDADFSECNYSEFYEYPNQENTETGMSPVTVKTQEEILQRFCKGAKPLCHCVWNKLYKRELVENELFALGYQSQDILFSCQIFCKCKKAAHIENVLYHYRSRPGSASNKFVKQRHDALEMAYRSLELLQETRPEFVKDFKSYYYSLILGAVDWAIREQPSKKRSKMIHSANTYRKKVNLTKEEWKTSSLKQRIRCVSSLPGLNMLSLRLRHVLSALRLIKD